jgi:hypothetical protein
MDIPEFVPTLAELFEASQEWGAQCRWHNQKKSGQNVIRCRNIIRGHDARERDGLIDSLRVLIRFPAETTTLGSAIPNSLPEIREKLEKVSMWLLCKGKHRPQSRKIVRKWCDELATLEEARVDNLGEAKVHNIEEARVDNVEEARDQPATNDVREELNIRKELNIQDGEKILCHGKKGDGTRCKQRVSAKNRQHADVIIAALARDRDISPTTRNTLFLLAELLLCQRFHQDQAFEKSEEWLRKVQELFPPADAAPEQPFTPPFSRTATVDSETPRSTASSVFSRVGSIAISTPTTSPPSERRYNTRATASGSPLRSRSTNTTTTIVDDEPLHVAHPRVTRRTTSERLAGLLTPEPVYPHFMPLPPKNSSAFLTNLYNLITRPFKKRDGLPGYLYGFKRDGGDYIKVGFTSKNSTEPRIRGWNTQCKQRVIVVLEKYVPHAGKMESLIHATLYHERRREALVNGACNDGRGCHKEHKEWFEVTLERLQEVVGEWIRWFERTPYDKDGHLKSEWVEKINKLRKEQKKPLPDLWRSWIDTTLAETNTVKVKTEVVDGKSTIAFDSEEKTNIIITETEIKVLADVPELRQELSKLSRGFVESIFELKGETPEEKPLKDYPVAPQDFSPYLGDPFGASATTTLPPAPLRSGRKTEAHPL